MKTIIATKNAPAAIGPYSQAVKANGFVFVSGQIALDPSTGEFVPGGIQEQTRQAIINGQSILIEAGLGLEHVIKTTVFLADMKDFNAMNEIYAQFFDHDAPARSAVQVAELPRGARVEVELIAAE